METDSDIDLDLTPPNIIEAAKVTTLKSLPETSKSVTQCQQLLLSSEELEPSVRRGDIYALMIQHYVKSGNFSEAKQMCFELRQDLNKMNNMPITYYLNRNVIEELAKGLGIPVDHIVPTTPKLPDRNEDNGTEIVEEVFED